MNNAHRKYYFFFMAALGANIGSGGRRTNAYHTNRMLHSFNSRIVATSNAIRLVP